MFSAAVRVGGSEWARASAGPEEKLQSLTLALSPLSTAGQSFSDAHPTGEFSHHRVVVDAAGCRRMRLFRRSRWARMRIAAGAV